MVSQFLTSLAAPLNAGNNTTTEVYVTSIQTSDQTPHTLTMSDFPLGVGYIVIDPQGTFEIIKFTGIDGSGIGFTGTSGNRGLPTYISGGETTITANVQAHSAGVDVVITDNINWWADHYVDTATNQTIGGLKTFSSAVTLPSADNATGHQAVSYNQAATILAGGAGNASTTVFGLTKISVAPASAGDPIAIGSNDNSTVMGLITSESGTVISASNPAIDSLTMPSGTIMMYAGTSAPTGWLFCNGASYLRTGIYANLYAAIGVGFGNADGTHFYVPDFRGRTPIGVGTGAGGGTSGSATLPTGGSALTARALGDWAGEETHQLTTTEMPSHTHPYGEASNATASGSSGSSPNGAGASPPFTTASTGGDGAHNNIQPMLAMNFIIKL